MVKGVFVVLDGVADEPCQVLGQITPLQAAKTPNLDEIVRKSKLDYCYTIKEGVAPESSSAVISLLGQDPNLAPRGPLEARGAGVGLAHGDLAFRCNFATVDDLNGSVLDPRAGRTLTTKEARILAKAVNQNVKLPFKFEFHPTLQHRGVLVFRGGFSDNITNVNPFYSGGSARIGVNPRVVFSKPMDEEDDSKLAADLVNSFIRQSHEVLDKHPLNAIRAKKGLFSANFILARGAGNEPIKFKKLKGNWMVLGYMPLEKGIAEACKMKVWKFDYPKLKGIDSYGNLYAGLSKAIKVGIKMLLKNRKKYDYFYIHFKETDIPGHDNKPLEKMKMIEIIDRKFFGFLKKYIEKNKTRLVVTSDHATSSRLKAHSADPVPVLFYNPDNLKDIEQRFTEEQALKGRKILGGRLLEKTLFSK